MWEKNIVQKLSNQKQDVEAFINVINYRDDVRKLNFQEDEVQKYVGKFYEQRKIGPVVKENNSAMKPQKTLSLGEYMAMKVKGEQAKMKFTQGLSAFIK